MEVDRYTGSIEKGIMKNNKKMPFYATADDFMHRKYVINTTGFIWVVPL